MQVEADITVTLSKDEVRVWVVSQLRAKGLELAGSGSTIATRSDPFDAIVVKAKMVPVASKRHIDDQLKRLRGVSV